MIYALAHLVIAHPLASFFIDIVPRFSRFLFPFRLLPFWRRIRFGKIGAFVLSSRWIFIFAKFILFFIIPLLHRFVVLCFLFFRFLVSFGEKVSCIVIYKANLKSLIAWWVIKVKLLSRFIIFFAITMNFHWYSMSTIFEDLWRSYMYNPSRLLFYSKKSRTILLFFFQTLYRDYSNLYYKNFHNYIFFKNACSSWLIIYICLTKRIEHDG